MTTQKLYAALPALCWSSQELWAKIPLHFIIYHRNSNKGIVLAVFLFRLVQNMQRIYNSQAISKNVCATIFPSNVKKTDLKRFDANTKSEWVHVCMTWSIKIIDWKSNTFAIYLWLNDFFNHWKISDFGAQVFYPAEKEIVPWPEG